MIGNDHLPKAFPWKLSFTLKMSGKIIIYAGEVIGGDPQALDESTDIRFVGPDEIPFNELAFDTTRAAFRDWQAWLNYGQGH